ncbi:MAG: glutamate synthase [Deltaproteobacteria bacterium]|nr:glutamate synthase [Deltaproteobacteria bacterium]
MTLTPIPLTTLARRLFGELACDAPSVLEVPRKKLWLGEPGLDLGVRHHGRRAATPIGPAAGPHTQLAQNIVAAWLAGARIIELKTVQILDDLVIPRPCIDMATVGFNVEWSQELRLAESAVEYVKAAMLVAMLRRRLGLGDEAGETLFDLSVGYDLAGIRSEPVQRFLDAMRDARPLVEQLRAELPRELGALLDPEPPTTIARSVTLSTFHGCPPGELEAIARWLMQERGLDVTIKLNPTLLGKARLLALLHDRLGYTDLKVPDSAIESDATWEEVTGIVSRLRGVARGLGRGFGIKLTNTLVVENHRDFFPSSERVMYLSGAPLHALALALLSDFREAFGPELPVSLSAGVDRHNVADAVALGLVPVTVCSDLLQPGGYARAAGYLAELAARMRAVGASDIPGFIRATGADLVAAARERAAAAAADPRYARAHNARPPKKLARTLATFDCTSCDKCVPVCPNTAIFGLEVARAGAAAHQIGILADACNDCGNCDVFCPEHGGPNLSKPRFHLTRAGYLAEAPRDGVVVERIRDALFATGRLGGRELQVALDGPCEPGLAADLQALARAAVHVAVQHGRADTWIAAHLRAAEQKEIGA